MADAQPAPRLVPIADRPDILKNTVTVTAGGFHFTLRIPSMKDRMKISSMAAKLRRDNDPDGTGFAYGYDIMSMQLFDQVATFIVLYKDSDCPWVLTPSPEDASKPVMDTDKWPENAPIAEVIEQFNIELDKFRKAGH